MNWSTGRSRRRCLAPVRFTPVAGARVGSRKVALGSVTVDVRPAVPTGPPAAHRSAYVAPAVGPSAAWESGRGVPSREPSTETGVPVVEMFPDRRLARRGVLPLRFAMAQNARPE